MPENLTVSYESQTAMGFCNFSFAYSIMETERRRIHLAEPMLQKVYWHGAFAETLQLEFHRGRKYIFTESL